MTTMTDKQKQVTEAFINEIEKELVIRLDCDAVCCEYYTDVEWDIIEKLCKKYDNLCEYVVKGYGVGKSLKLFLKYERLEDLDELIDEYKNIYAILTKYILIRLMSLKYGGDWLVYVGFSKKHGLECSEPLEEEIEWNKNWWDSINEEEKNK